MEESGGRRQKFWLVVAIVLLLATGVIAWIQLGGKSVYDMSYERAFICAETLKPYEYTIKMGDSMPYYSPHTDRNTGYPAELCYWTRDENGRWAQKDKPTLVLVQKYLDPTTEEKTYCPDCGREVVQHNPAPTDAEIAEANAESGY